MDDTTILGGVLGQLGQTAKKAGQQIVKVPEEMGGDVAGQLESIKQNDTQAASPKSSGEPQWVSDEERIKFLKDLYGSGKPSSDASVVDKSADKAKEKPEKSQTSANPLTTSVENKKPSEFQEQIKDKSPEEQKELMQLRQQLHKEVYYDPTFNPVKKQEERPAEKVEKEKKMEMIDLQKKEDKKPQPLAVTREQNKTEQFRGAAG